MNTNRAHERDPRNGTLWLPRWDASYAQNTGHHRVYDDLFLETTPLAPDGRVLDIGCGPGDFTRIVADRVAAGHVVGLDPQTVLLEQARARAASNQSFVLGPAQQLGELFPHDGSFDVVMSRAALQWVPIADHPGILAECLRLLRPGGWFRLEMGGAGNIPAMVALLDQVSPAHGGRLSPWTFPNAGKYLDLLEAAGFVVDRAEGGYVRTMAQRRPFDLASLVGWLRSQCYQAFDDSIPPERQAAFRAEVERRLDEVRRPDGTFDQTYVRLDALARKR